MRTRSYAAFVITALIVALAALAWNQLGPDADANPPTSLFFMFKKVDADPNKDYTLTENNGPWMIMATTFRGDKAAEQARQLVYELRKQYKLNAYASKQVYDYKQRGLPGIGFNPDGTPKRMINANAERVEAVAVLVGDYRSIDDPDGHKVLVMLKQLQPECMKTEADKASSSNFSELRRMSQKMFGDSGGTTKKDAGPLASAIMTTNPMLPKEFFAPKPGLDKFVIDLNRGDEFSLLDCPGRYSVKIATFTGKVIIDQRKINDIEHGGKDIIPREKADDTDPLVKATKRADALAAELRKHNIEAYSFHDRYSSVVTVGSFNTVGTPRQDGKTEINPQIYKIMQEYGPNQPSTVVNAGTNAIGQKSVQVTIDKKRESVLLDVQPIPIEVPRRSIGTDYQQTSFYR